jgi:hypothetical protein
VSGKNNTPYCSLFTPDLSFYFLPISCSSFSHFSFSFSYCIAVIPASG